MKEVRTCISSIEPAVKTSELYFFLNSIACKLGHKNRPASRWNIIYSSMFSFVCKFFNVKSSENGKEAAGFMARVAIIICVIRFESCMLLMLVVQDRFLYMCACI